MTDIKICSIRNKSHYSCGLAIGTSEQYLDSCLKKGITSFVISDKGTMGGALDFFNLSKKKKVSVMIGVELDVESFYPYSVVLICKSQLGYSNLCKLVTAYNKNSGKIRMMELHNHCQDIVCVSTSCVEHDQLFPIFKDDLYYEINFYDKDQERSRNNLSHQFERCVFSFDSHMPDQEDKVLQDIMIENSSFSDSVKKMEDCRSLLTIEEALKKMMIQGYSSHLIIRTINKTKEIHTKCSSLTLKFKDQIVNYPHLLHPLNTNNCSKEELLLKIILNNNRFDIKDLIYKDRLIMEIDAITKNSRVNLVDYFLVLEDLCRFCRNNGIAVGPGRGSGAGSLILYGLNVTQLDPIKFGLLFERFISKGRIEAGTLPDVDLDFSEQEPVRKYLIDVYGEDRVKPIGTYQTLALRGSIRDAFRFLYPDVDFFTVNNICMTIDDKLDGDDELNDFENQITYNEHFKIAMMPYPKVAEVVHKLNGYNRQQGIHPCGLAITQDKIEDIMPIRITKGKEVLEYQAQHCEQSGVIKYDILGLKTLKFFQMCLELINKKSTDKVPKLNLNDIPLNDRQTFQAFEIGDTESVFQFNSSVSKNILTKIKITSLDDLSMVTSVGRPGPMENGQHFSFIKRKNDKEPCDPPHEAVKDLLKDTYGIMIYQEAVMKTAQIMGGFTLAEADDIRKAMGKKKVEILLPYKDRFIKNCMELYPDTQIKTKFDGEKEVSKAEHIWNLMEKFSGYGFNKSHSMSYALIGYYCQYLKVHYPLEWWCACLNNADDSDHVKVYYSAYKHRIVPPTIRNTETNFYIEYFDKMYFDENDMDVEGLIHMPLWCVKGVGEKAVNEINKHAPYSSLAEFYSKVQKRTVNQGVVMNMIYAGCFLPFSDDVRKLIAEYFALRKDKVPEELQNITDQKLLEMKHNVLSFLTMDYCEIYSNHIENCKYPSDLEHMKHGDKCSIIGRIVKVSERKTKKKEKFLVMDVTNKDQTYSVTVWPVEASIYKQKVEEDSVVYMEGMVKRDWGDKIQFTASKIFTTEEITKFRR